MAEREAWTTRQAAAHCHCRPHTFRSYTRINGAPNPIPDRFGPGGERMFWADEVIAWQASRRGMGKPRISTHITQETR